MFKLIWYDVVCLSQSYSRSKETEVLADTLENANFVNTYPEVETLTLTRLVKARGIDLIANACSGETSNNCVLRFALVT